MKKALKNSKYIAINFTYSFLLNGGHDLKLENHGSIPEVKSGHLII